MVKLNMDALELDYKTDIHTVHDLCKDKITFLGNLDPTGIVRNGTFIDIEEKVTELIACYQDSPRLIINAGCAIPADTNPENIEKLVEVARHFRR